MSVFSTREEKRKLSVCKFEGARVVLNKTIKKKTYLYTLLNILQLFLLFISIKLIKTLTESCLKQNIHILIKKKK